MKTATKLFSYALGLFFLSLTIAQIACGPEAVSEFLGIASTGAGSITMAAALINIGGMTFNGKEAKDMGDAVLESAFQNPTLTSLHTIVPGIVAKTQVVYLGRISKISKAAQGCDPDDLDKTIPTSQKFYNPEDIDWRVGLCATDLKNSFFIWGQKNGISRYDLTGTDAAKFIMMRLEEALVEDVLRIAWFNHKDAANVNDSPAGIITAGTDVDDYNIIDGFWEQIYTIVTTTPARKTAIAKNAQATYSTQLALGATDAYDTFKAMAENCDKRLKGAADKVIICTDTLVDNYQSYLESKDVDSSFSRIETKGLPAWDTGMRFRGIPIYKFDFWDRTIQADFDNGTKYYDPHRALLTTVNNLQIAVPDPGEAGDVNNFYDNKSRKNYWEGAYKIDVKIVEDHMIQAAY